jgi:hypothetical protein
VGKAVQQTVDKVRKVADEFPAISRHSSSSSTASSKWAQAPLFQIRTRNSSKHKTSISSNQNYYSKEICSYIDLHPRQNPFQLHNGRQHKVSHRQSVRLTPGQTRRTIQIKCQIRHDFSLAITERSRKDFRDINKALPHNTEISTPGRPKQFIAIGNFNHTHGQFNILLNNEISTDRRDLGRDAYIVPKRIVTFENKRHPRKKGGDKVNNKEKRKDTTVKIQN